MRCAVIVISLVVTSACAGPSHFHPPALPELIATVRPTSLLQAPELRMIPGERMVWDVQAKGFSVARAEMVVGDTEVTSRVETGVLASTVTSLRHELVSQLDRDHARAQRAHETLVLEGKSTTIDAIFDAKDYMVDGKAMVNVPGVQSIHSAIGLLRAWIAPDAHAGVVPILVGGELYRLEVASPTLTKLSGKDAYRIDCRIGSLGAVTLWLATTDDHTPLRIEVSTEDGKLTAELIERTEGH